jgi:twitching motility protein PilT
MEISELLRLCIEREASDLHIVAGRAPMLRIDGTLIEVDAPPLTPADTRKMLYGVLTDHQKQKFEAEKELDFSLAISKMSRFRVNAHFQRGSVGVTIRTISSVIKTYQDLGLPTRVCERIARRPHGLVLVTGPTGSGKSTLLAAMVDQINTERACHIITVEDPIEYIHPHKKALIEQRELGEDTYSFANALKHVLRQDPDVILVGEMRDLETISAAITAAETGHLVFSTVHTNDVAQTIDRLVDVFPSHQQNQVRQMLGGVIEAIFCQRLLPNAHGRGREVVLEILVGTDSIRNLIREGKVHQIYTQIEASGNVGMQTMDRAIADLYKRGRITREVAMGAARKPEELKRHLMSLTAATGANA